MGRPRPRNEMNLESLGNIGEFIGGIAVIVTLVYLAFQVRQSSTTLRANSVHELTENILRASANLVEPKNAEVYLRGARSYSSLTPEEKLRFQLLIGLFVGRFDTVLEYRERGMVDDAYVEWQVEAMRRIFENPGVREFWKSRGQGSVTARVQEWVEKNLAVAR